MCLQRQNIQNKVLCKIRLVRNNRKRLKLKIMCDRITKLMKNLRGFLRRLAYLINGLIRILFTQYFICSYDGSPECMGFTVFWYDVNNLVMKIEYSHSAHVSCSDLRY